MTIARALNNPFLRAKAESTPKTESAAPAPCSMDYQLEEGDMWFEDWLKTPESLAIDEWEKAHPEEAAQIEQEVLKEAGLA